MRNRMFLRYKFGYLAIFLSLFSKSYLFANTCDVAASSASFHKNVPSSILRGITRLETGRTKNGKLEPWPWTINDRGKGYWFPDKITAVNHAKSLISQNIRSFDIGCFQINYRWHGEHFNSVEDMFNPTTNAAYAAKFLNQLFHEKGDWDHAIAAYHSRTPKYANRYLAKFHRIHSRLEPASTQFASLGSPKQQANLRPKLGSLVPLETKQNTPLIQGLN